MQNILFIHRHSLDPEGRGGHHRSYHIFTDLRAKFGDTVNAVSLDTLSLKNPSRSSQVTRRIKARFNLALFALKVGYHPEKVLNELLTQNGVMFKTFGEAPITKYLEHIEKNGKPSLCVIDSPAFLSIIRYNKENGIKTVYCPQNIDSFDICAHTLTNLSSRINCALRWMVEQEALATCDERWMISKLEQNIISGLGLSALHYPYKPVGEIRERLLGIRAYRRTNPERSNTLLMFGSITHRTTFESFRWLLKNLQKSGLPEGIQLQVAGRGGEKLAEEFSSIPNLHIHGLLSQDDLDHLLKQTSLVLLPQLSGFGALTRISEMACSGIPVLTSQHALAAMSLPPGVTALPNNYEAWFNAIDNMNKYSGGQSVDEYIAWENDQQNPVLEMLFE